VGLNYVDYAIIGALYVRKQLTVSELCRVINGVDVETCRKCIYKAGKPSERSRRVKPSCLVTYPNLLYHVRKLAKLGIVELEHTIVHDKHHPWYGKYIIMDRAVIVRLRKRLQR